MGYTPGNKVGIHPWEKGWDTPLETRLGYTPGNKVGEHSLGTRLGYTRGNKIGIHPWELGWDTPLVVICALPNCELRPTKNESKKIVLLTYFLRLGYQSPIVQLKFLQEIRQFCIKKYRGAWCIILGVKGHTKAVSVVVSFLASHL